MTKRRIRSSHIVKEDEISRMRREQALREVEAERPWIEERGQKLAAAQREQTLSGQLRRAAHKNWRDLDEMVQELGIAWEEYSDWLAGEGTLTSDVMDRLAKLVGYELVAVEHAESHSET